MAEEQQAVKKVVLIVEDERPMSEALKEVLEQNDLTALVARDGSEGLAVARHRHPDLILLDIVMPKMDGITMLRKLREDPWGKNVPVILLTNLQADNKTTLEVASTDPAFYLVKSDWQLSEVVQKIKERLGE